MAVFTTRLNLKKPAGGSSGSIPGDDQADIDDINDNSDIIDGAIGFAPVLSTGLPSVPFNGQPVMLTDANSMLKARSGTAWISPGIVGRGTAVHRDAYWPAPGDAAARVALANQYPLWFNTDKGWMEQYFAAYNDAGVGASTPTKPTAGWGPAMHVGIVPLKGGTLTQDAGTFAYQGGVYVFSGVTGGFKISGIFNDDFEHYRVHLDFDSAGADGDCGIQLWNGGASLGSIWSRNYVEITAGGAVAGVATTAQATGNVGRVAAAGGSLQVQVLSPKKARTSYVLAESVDRTNYQRRGSANTGSTTTACDGVEFRFSGGMTVAGKLRIYGYNDF